MKTLGKYGQNLRVDLTASDTPSALVTRMVLVNGLGRRLLLLRLLTPQILGRSLHRMRLIRISFTLQVRQLVSQLRLRTSGLVPG